MVGFIPNLAPLLHYLRCIWCVDEVRPPPFSPDSRQAGERGAKNMTNFFRRNRDLGTISVYVSYSDVHCLTHPRPYSSNPLFGRHRLSPVSLSPPARYLVPLPHLVHFLYTGDFLLAVLLGRLLEMY